MKAQSVSSTLLLCAVLVPAFAPAQDEDSQTAPPHAIPTPIVYRNTQYGFCFRLPADWQGYKIITEKWGTEVDGYPVLTIRNPKWTEGDPWQDIPIIIFTRKQWEDAANYDENVNVAGLGPTEIGRSQSYVFAQPPRWIGFEDLKGNDEVRTLMMQDPFQAPCGPPIVYHNTQYDFCFRLPAGWKGYKIVTETWSGVIPVTDPGKDPPRMMRGPLILIRNPAWSDDDPYQDIPIMVFAQAQWSEKEKYGVVLSNSGAEWGLFGSNARYVFKQPDRWIGYADAEEEREVENLMMTHPFQAPCPKGKMPVAK
jgi:hypothetical protein